MNILIFNWRDLKHSWAGGSELYVFEQAFRWVKKGHGVTVFCGEDSTKKLPRFEEIKGVKIYRRGGRFSIYLWAVWYYLKFFRGKHDVIIDVENGIPFFTPLYSRIPKVVYVHHVHSEQFYYEFPRLIAWIGVFMERFMFPFLYRNIPIITISKTTREKLLDIGFPKQNISIVYSGINEKIKFKKLKKFSKPTILYLGRIKSYKRIDMLVDIFNELLKKNSDLRLIIAGWGTEASNIADIVMKNPKRRKISLMGPVSEQEKRLILSRSWVFVNPSIGEGWSIAVIEANHYGTPAVAFNVPGLSESIRNGETGFLVNNSSEMIEVLNKIIHNVKLRTRLSKNSLEWARNFSWDNAAQKSLYIIEDIAQEK